MSAGRATERRCVLLAAILLVATVLRLAHLGRPSLGYDEVVQMTMARQPNPAALMRILYEIEATRAPLHPLVLQGWLRLFGASDFSGRVLSALCGIATVALIYSIGRRLYDAPTALWGAWLCALSPILVQYSQETKMYAWLVMLTCLAWLILISFRHSAPWWKQLGFAVCLVALSYSYPLSLFMVIALALAYLVNRSNYKLSLGHWLAIHAAWALAFVPWLPRYMDHPPEILFNLALPSLISWLITFVGGNSWTTLLIVLPLLCYGLVKQSDSPKGGPGTDQLEGRRSIAKHVGLDEPFAATSLLVWFSVPPALLLGYSLVRHPVFGPPRYLMFVCPAYLLLVARGLVKLRLSLRLVLALVLAVMAARLLGASVYSPAYKLDWRSAAAVVRAKDPRAKIVIFSIADKSPTLSRHPDVVNFGYYLDPSAQVLSAFDPSVMHRLDGSQPDKALWLAFIDLKASEPAPVPEPLARLYYPKFVWQSLRVRLVYNRLRSERGSGSEQGR